MAGYIGKSQGVVLTDIDNNSVTTADIQDGAVTDAKITGVSSSKLSGALPALDGSALTGIDSLPSQTGQSGNYLTTDGTNASWGAVDLSSYATTTALNTAVANSTNWDTAYGWGDHSTQNYATTTGDTMTGALNFGDNVKAQFGASNDLQIYHDGTNSFISDQGTGNLDIRSIDLRLRNAAGTSSYLHANNGGNVEIFYNGSKKLETTSTGVSVTGDMTLASNGAVNSELRSDYAGLQLGTTSNHYLAFRTNNTERMRITTDGRGLSDFTAKAWVSFNGTGTVAINDSHNVSSVTDNAVGDYTVSFSNSLANTNYCAIANGRENNGTGGHFAQVPHVTTPQTGSFRLGLFNATFSLRDGYHIMAVAFGG